MSQPLMLLLWTSLLANLALMAIILRAGRRWRDLKNAVKAHRNYVPDDLFPRPDRDLSREGQIFMRASNYWCNMIIAMIEGQPRI